ncbi:hypothetical protein K466DRAFT_23972 [Polyporus arcularius HHB13444]|uniref:Uncharacterized protein n=1 Tax=Polyporus arcularius HHB13444 TaxID=1314778 RepID=A0A5C3PIF4_9APHY|nr:hypothetical protein K466DRAFT_23972 [Polyporus arcularius HHB13444]
MYHAIVWGGEKHGIGGRRSRSLPARATPRAAGVGKQGTRWRRLGLGSPNASRRCLSECQSGSWPRAGLGRCHGNVRDVKEVPPVRNRGSSELSLSLSGGGMEMWLELGLWVALVVCCVHDTYGLAPGGCRNPACRRVGLYRYAMGCSVRWLGGSTRLPTSGLADRRTGFLGSGRACAGGRGP